jgi:hypothetical protein
MVTMTVLRWILAPGIFGDFPKGLLLGGILPPNGEDDSSALHPTSSRQTLIPNAVRFLFALLWLLPRGPSRVSRLFVHDGDGFLLLALLLFVDCRFSANLLRGGGKKKEYPVLHTNPSAENGLETQMKKLPELLADHSALLQTLCRN